MNKKHYEEHTRKISKKAMEKFKAGIDETVALNVEAGEESFILRCSREAYGNSGTAAEIQTTGARIY